jgi:hypothetical protein
MIRQYVVRTRFVFKGAFFVKARNKDEAKELVEKYCGMTLGRNIHTSLPNEDVDWDFPVHPDKAVGRISAKKQLRKEDSHESKLKQ